MTSVYASSTGGYPAKRIAQLIQLYVSPQTPVAVKFAVKREKAPDFSRAFSSSIAIWRRRADSNRRIEVLQTSALTAWPRRRTNMFDCRFLPEGRFVFQPLGLGNRYFFVVYSTYFYMVPRAGLEPARPYEHSALNAACLPIPTPRLMY